MMLKWELLAPSFHVKRQRAAPWSVTKAVHEGNQPRIVSLGVLESGRTCRALLRGSCTSLAMANNDASRTIGFARVGGDCLWIQGEAVDNVGDNR